MAGCNIGKIDHVLPKYAGKIFGVLKLVDRNYHKRGKVKREESSFQYNESVNSTVLHYLYRYISNQTLKDKFHGGYSTPKL